MGCGCGAKGVKSFSKKGYGSIVTPKSATVSATSVSNRPKTITKQNANSGMTTERRELERQRREILLKKLGRL